MTDCVAKDFNLTVPILCPKTCDIFLPVISELSASN